MSKRKTPYEGKTISALNLTLPKTNVMKNMVPIVPRKWPVRNSKRQNKNS